MKVVFLNFLQIINRFQNLYVPILYTNGGEGFFQEEENPIPQAFNRFCGLIKPKIIL
jgi:hypothetical protein